MTAMIMRDVTLSRLVIRLALAPALALGLSANSLAQERQVAVTFDDLPGPHLTRPCDLDWLRDSHQKLLATLDRHNITTVGFVNESRLCRELPQEALAEILTMWLDASHDLGNHTYSHPNLDNTSVEDYERDIVRGEKTTKRLLEARGRHLRWFRYPFLHAGDTAEKRQAILDFLGERKYEMGVVTFDNQEWMYAIVYARAKRKGDSELMARLVEGYVDHMRASFVFFEGYSKKIFGREIPQVLVVHANSINVDHFERIVDVLKRRGYEFVSMDEAVRDPAYNAPEEYVDTYGPSWLLRWGQAKGFDTAGEVREPKWLVHLYRNYR